jgi:hypothetical protein
MADADEQKVASDAHSSAIACGSATRIALDVPFGLFGWA